MKPIYEIKMTHQDIGVFLTSKKLADEYLEKFATEDCREEYFIHEIKDPKDLPDDAIVCSSLEELMEKKPEQKVERLWVMRHDLQTKEYKLPCEITVYFPVRQNPKSFAERMLVSYKDFDLKGRAVSSLGYQDLKNLVKAAEQNFLNKSVENTYRFLFKEFAGKSNQFKAIEVELNEDQFTKLKKFYDDIEKRIERISEGIEIAEKEIEECNCVEY